MTTDRAVTLIVGHHQDDVRARLRKCIGFGIFSNREREKQSCHDKGELHRFVFPVSDSGFLVRVSRAASHCKRSAASPLSLTLGKAFVSLRCPLNCQQRNDLEALPPAKDPRVWNATEFRRIVSGERNDPFAMLLRAGFGAASLPYGIAVQWRNRAFDTSHRQIHRVDVPVISVGNLTVGGTGKTPMVEWLAKWFRERDVRVCLISRGYGAEAGARNDEALELEQKLPDVPHLQNPDRVAAARTAVEEFETELLLLDDGFQHRRIHRDLDIVLLDALEPFGYDSLLPRGLLREPVSSLARADVVALSRADAVDERWRAEIREVAMRHAPNAIWIELTHQPHQFLDSQGNIATIDSLCGRPIAAFCGIGNPAGFRHTLEACGLEVVAFRDFPDHHSYTEADITSLAELACNAKSLVCTHKDLVKILVSEVAAIPLWAVQIGLSIEEGQEPLEKKLKALLAAGETR